MRLNRNSMLTTVLAVFAVVVLATNAHAAQEKTLHSFGEGGDGQNPLGGLVMDAAHNLYGTTQEGGSGEEGTAFELSPDGHGGWTETVLFNFEHEHGALPHGGLIIDGHGNLYGTTALGGAHGDGTVFELSPNGSGGWTETVLHSFDHFDGDGITPIANLTMDAGGNLYGTTYAGGMPEPECHDGCGTVFKLSRNGSGWTETVLHRFNAQDGAKPFGGVVLDSAGNVYGTTSEGGQFASQFGVAFELSPNGSGGWIETILHVFDRDDPAGSRPLGGLILDGMGNLYGTTSDGGSARAGTAFKLSPNGNDGWTVKTLHSFGGRNDGWHPGAALAFDSAGNLYGTTQTGGIGHQRGIVFKLSPNGSGGWNETILHSFAPENGSTPQAPVIVDPAGDVFGTTSMGGAHNRGVVFGISQ
jgi:uncharacterized repeat protein (TIGR03803 family)